MDKGLFSFPLCLCFLVGIIYMRCTLIFCPFRTISLGLGFKLLAVARFVEEKRGAVLVCALPWLKSLLLQHASAIMFQDSSIRALNSLYQIIESRVSTFQSALQLSSVLDYLFVGVSELRFIKGGLGDNTSC
ncbi:hypothetical protein IFM89_035720 [Coptis chinensis]|uniref:Small-subunit processome Utp12 domain-containing protein n=1 Tax=Coptis chinensis TaxID=261450 RepID=A0A835H0V7_9MAGN|nr:hypothetical protein IFM89_035720 [Coptis chinensis]